MSDPSCVICIKASHPTAIPLPPQPFRDGNLAVLFSFSPTSSSSDDGSALLSYAVAVLKSDSENENGGDGLSLMNLLRLPYRSVSLIPINSSEVRTAKADGVHLDLACRT